MGEGVSQEELNCNQQLATFKGKKKPCPLSALGGAFPGAQMRSVGASPFWACLGFPWFIQYGSNTDQAWLTVDPRTHGPCIHALYFFKNIEILLMNIEIFNLMF